MVSELKILYQEQGFLEHLEAFLYFSVFGSLPSYRYQRCQVADMWSNVIVL